MLFGIFVFSFHVFNVIFPFIYSLKIFMSFKSVAETSMSIFIYTTLNICYYIQFQKELNGQSFSDCPMRFCGM